MIHQEGVVPPGLGGNLMSSKVVELSQHAVRRKVKRSVAIAAGFGGAMGVISLVTA
jgi:hypothetical protein